MRTVKVLATVAALLVGAWTNVGSADVIVPDSSGPCDPNFSADGTSPSLSDLGNVTIEKCAGFYEGNALNTGNQATLDLVNGILAGWTMDPVASWITKYTTGSGDVPNSEGYIVIDFGYTLYGPTLVSAHWGNYPDNPDNDGNVSALYYFDAGSTGLDYLLVAGRTGLSNVVLWRTEVPEPGTLALLGLGLAGLGFGGHRRKT